MDNEKNRMPLPFKVKVEKRNSSENSSLNNSFEQQTKDDNLSEIHDIANSVSELHSETKAVEHRFNLLSVSNFESEMSDMKQLQEKSVKNLTLLI